MASGLSSEHSPSLPAKPSSPSTLLYSELPPSKPSTPPSSPISHVTPGTPTSDAYATGARAGRLTRFAAETAGASPPDPYLAAHSGASRSSRAPLFPPPLRQLSSRKSSLLCPPPLRQQSSRKSASQARLTLRAAAPQGQKSQCVVVSMDLLWTDVTGESLHSPLSLSLARARARAICGT